MRTENTTPIFDRRKRTNITRYIHSAVESFMDKAVRRKTLNIEAPLETFDINLSEFRKMVSRNIDVQFAPVIAELIEIRVNAELTNDRRL